MPNTRRRAEQSNTSSVNTILTPWCRVLLEKLTGLQLVKKFPAFYGTRRFITALTSVLRNWISSRGQPTKGGPPAWGLGEVLATPPCKTFMLRNTCVNTIMEITINVSEYRSASIFRINKPSTQNSGQSIDMGKRGRVFGRTDKTLAVVQRADGRGRSTDVGRKMSQKRYIRMKVKEIPVTPKTYFFSPTPALFNPQKATLDIRT